MGSRLPRRPSAGSCRACPAECCRTVTVRDQLASQLVSWKTGYQSAAHRNPMAADSDEPVWPRDDALNKLEWKSVSIQDAPPRKTRAHPVLGP